MNQIMIDEKWYTIGAAELVGSLPDEQLVLMIGATLKAIEAGTYKDKDTWRFPLTPIPTPVWARLGREVLTFVPKERQGDILNFGMEPDGCAMAELIAHSGVRAAQENVTYFPVIWLSPPPAPPKTTEELLADIVTIHDAVGNSGGMIGVALSRSDREKLAVAIKAARQHLDEMKGQG